MEFCCLWIRNMDRRKKSEERVVNAFETRCWRIMLKIKWIDKITNDRSFIKGERRNITFKNFKK